MDIHTIIMGLWIGSAIFYWAAIGFAALLVGLSVYLILSDWDGAVITFYEWVDRSKRILKNNSTK